MPDYNKAMQKLIEAAMYAAPDESTKAAFKRYAQEVAREALEDDHTHMRLLTGGLYDGLAYGNWPNMSVDLSA